MMNGDTRGAQSPSCAAISVFKILTHVLSISTSNRNGGTRRWRRELGETRASFCLPQTCLHVFPIGEEG